MALIEKQQKIPRSKRTRKKKLEGCCPIIGGENRYVELQDRTLPPGTWKTRPVHGQRRRGPN